MDVEFKFHDEDGCNQLSGSIRCSIFTIIPRITAKIEGDEGILEITNFVAPQYCEYISSLFYLLTTGLF